MAILYVVKTRQALRQVHTSRVIGRLRTLGLKLYFKGSNFGHHRKGRENVINDSIKLNMEQHVPGMTLHTPRARRTIQTHATLMGP
jgi:hypothetical protein